jgi:hypothetical protein
MINHELVFIPSMLDDAMSSCASSDKTCYGTITLARVITNFVDGI